MKKKNGFVFIETIITIVFLAAALLVLYGSYRNAITEEKTKVYYDDIGYLYRNYYLADFLINKTEINDLKDTGFNEKYTLEINKDVYSELFTEYQASEDYPAELENITKKFNVNKMLVVSDEIITECFNAAANKKCDASYEGLSEGLSRYIETMNVERDEDDRVNYYLVTEYKEKSTEDGVAKCNENEENCQSFYVTLKLDINKEIEVGESSLGEVCKGKNFAKCLKDNYKLENNEEGGIYYHDKDGEDSGYGEDEAGDYSYRYAGVNVKNYICFGTDEDTCPDENMYRIIGVYGNNIKLIKEKDINKANSGVTTRSDMINGYESKWQNMVTNAAWYTTGFARSEIGKTAKEVYAAEIKGATTNSKTGLMYVNEYMYSAHPSYWETIGTAYSQAREKNWMYQAGLIEWSVSKEVGTSNYYAINIEGNVGWNPSSTVSMARGTINLKDTIILTGGEGTRSNPYRVADVGVIIKSVGKNESFHSIEVEVTAESQDGRISKYFYSIDEGKTWKESESYKYTFDGLESDKDYKIRVKALNNRGNYSEEYELPCHTLYEGPKVVLEHVSQTINQVVVKATTTIGSGTIAKYEYKVGNGSWVTVNSSAIVDTHTFTGLTSNTEYTFTVRVTDQKGLTAEASVKAKTDYEDPKVDLAVSVVDYYSISLRAIGTAGSGTIKKYDYYLNGKYVYTNNMAASNTYVYQSLNENTSYTLKVVVTDVNGHTGERSLTQKTNQILTPTLNITSSSETDSITVYPNATARSGTLSSCRYKIGTNAWVTGNCSSYTFTNLTMSTNYTISVEATNSYNKSTSASKTIKTADVKKPTVRITNAYGTGTNSIYVSATGTKGTYSIDRYEFYVGNKKCTKSTSGTSASCDVTGLSIDTYYSITVYIYDTKGNYSTASSSARTLSVVDPQVEITNAYGTSADSIYVSARGTKGTYSIDRYEYYVDGYKECTRYDSSSSSCTISGLSMNSYHSITVYIYDTQGNWDSDYSSAYTLDVDEPQVRISSAYATGPNSIHVDAYVTKGTYSISSVQFYANYSLKCTKSGSGTVSCDMTGLSEDTSYSIEVDVYDTQGNSDYAYSSARTEKKPVVKEGWQWEGSCWKYFESGSWLGGWRWLRIDSSTWSSEYRWWFLSTSNGCLQTGRQYLPKSTEAGANKGYCYYYISESDGMQKNTSIGGYCYGNDGCQTTCSSSGGGSSNSCSPYRTCSCYCYEDTTYKAHQKSFCANDCNSACQYQGYASGSGSCW